LQNEVLTIIQARLRSTRLPSKPLMDLAGKTVLEHVIDRVSQSKLTGKLIIATTVNVADLPIVKVCVDMGVSVYRGCEEDPLERYYQAARLFGASHVVRIKSDCPMIDPEIIDEAIGVHLESGADYTSNTIQRTYPVGQDVEILTNETLTRVWQSALRFSEREHITIYIANNPGLFNIRYLKNVENLSGKRWTLDYPEDYELLRTIFNNVYRKKNNFRMKDVLDFLSKKPELEGLNSHISSDSGLQKSIREDRLVSLSHQNPQ